MACDGRLEPITGHFQREGVSVGCSTNADVCARPFSERESCRESCCSIKHCQQLPTLQRNQKTGRQTYQEEGLKESLTINQIKLVSVSAKCF